MEHAPKFDIATLWETKRQNDLFWRSVLAYGNYEDKIALAIADPLSKSEQEQISSLLGHIESVIPQNYLYDPERQEHYPFYELSYREIDRQSYNSILIHYPGTNIDDPEYIVVIYCRCDRSKASKDSFSREYRTVLCPPGGNALYDQ